VLADAVLHGPLHGYVWSGIGCSALTFGSRDQLNQPAGNSVSPLRHLLRRRSLPLVSLAVQWPLVAADGAGLQAGV